MTLRKIRQSGLITVGHRESTPPFSYLDDRQRPIGYSVDICERVIRAVQSRLQLRRLAVKWVPVTLATRVPMVANGSIDLECGVTTHNKERESKVGFSLTFFVAESRFVSKRSSPVMTLGDLRGRSVVTTLGTTSIRHLYDLNDRLKLNASVLAVKDDPEAFGMVQSNRVAAYAMDDVLLRSTVAASGNPQDYVISDDVLAVEPYAVMLPKEDKAFKQLVDDTIAALYRSGEIDEVYRKWFQSPIPPLGMNLQMPMAESLRRVYRNPTDSGDPADYR